MTLTPVLLWVFVSSACSVVAAEGPVVCDAPANAVSNWRAAANDPHTFNCTDALTKKGTYMTMLRAYRRGAIEGVHWKYTDDKHDLACLSHWTYYGGTNGKHEIGVVSGRTTFLASDRRCALPRYQQGAEGYTWATCTCHALTPEIDWDRHLPSR